MTVDRRARWAWTVAFVVGCGGDSSQGDDDTTSDGEPSTSDAPTTTSASDDPDSSGGADSSSSGEVETSDEGSVSDTSDDPPDPPDPPLPCAEDWDCKEDRDGDDKPLSCDNAPDHTNPDQGDMDFDSFGDIVDLCPTVQSLNNTLDSDKDGVGNACDTCPRPSALYQVVPMPARYEVRNTPAQGDADEDGVGDACDNCPLVPNCLGYGDGPGLTPWVPGLPLDPEDPECNADANLDGIGDACAGDAGVGFADADDFDGDGIDNGDDACPRIRAADGAHADPDGDGFGTECDVCPFVADPSQADDDGDFIGDACEEHLGCVDRDNPRPLAFYDVAVGGYCCTTYYTGQAFEDPDGMPLGAEDFPASEPGLLELPPGCDAALADAGVASATALGPADVGGLAALWSHVCLLPAWDQDLDAIPDACDLCEFAFDPSNAPYVDDNGMEWPNYGAVCNGEYSCDAQR